MSKAFTRESDDSDGDEIPVRRRELPPGTRNLITRAGADRLRQRLDGWLQQRQAVSDHSPAPGSEEQVRLRKLDASIRLFQDTLSTIVVADPPLDRTKAGFGATVLVRYPDGSDESFRIVGVDEAEPERGSISWLSPLAKALLAKRAGDRLSFQEQELEVLTVSYE
jgi:transcription elongation factor GreB